MTPAAAAAIGGVVVALLSKVVDYFLARKKIVIDDDTSLRKDLMAERASLIAELGVMGERCSKCEAENGRLHTEIIEIQRDHESATNVLNRRVWELEIEIERMKKVFIEHGLPNKDISERDTPEAH